MSRPLLLLTLAAALVATPAAAGGGKKKGGGAAYLQLPPLTAVVVRPDGRRGVMTVETGVDVKDPSLHARAEASLPRLRAAYVAAVQAHAHGLPPGSAPNADRLAGQLQRET
ncbi:MAG: hypothetical protein M3M95_01615, partial [Pseudomonadota bacterium]|nr:hypothetical protein [Pseudomonadota bacterium]